jgi:hypothetical protein
MLYVKLVENMLHMEEAGQNIFDVVLIRTCFMGICPEHFNGMLVRI